MNIWRRTVGGRPIVTRLVIAVAASMAIVLLAAGAFVFWRVDYALDKQLDRDLHAYQEVVERDVHDGVPLLRDTPGQSYQIYDTGGRVIGGTATTRLVDEATVRDTKPGRELHEDVGNFLQRHDHPYRVVTEVVTTSTGPVVVASAISRTSRDEALRELLLQLAIADLATLAAASMVGYGTARAALNPVERYRIAAEHARADDQPRLPVTEDRDDELTRLVHTFNALLERIGEANERERQFLADAAHELRSPLSLMRTELEWISLRPRDSGETSTALSSLRSQVEHLIDLSNAVLELEELRGAAAPPSELIAVHGLVADVVAPLEPSAAAQGRKIEYDVPDDLAVDGNRRWLELALTNLVSNALRHGERTVTVTARLLVGRVRLTVADEGAGFPSAFIGRAFDRFTRADESRTTQGTGLGLALVRAIAELHGGSATIDGARVTLDLPGGQLPDAPAGSADTRPAHLPR
jgi:signal transduction histidine kinase